MINTNTCQGVAPHDVNKPSDNNLIGTESGNNPTIDESGKNTANGSAPVASLMEDQIKGPPNGTFDCPNVTIDESLNVPNNRTNSEGRPVSEVELPVSELRDENFGANTSFTTSSVRSKMSIGTLRSIASSIRTIGSILTIGSLASLAVTISSGMAGMGGYFANLLAQLSMLNHPVSESEKRNQVVSILEVIGLTTEEADLALKSLQVADLETAIFVLDDVFSSSILKIGVNTDRALYLTQGFSAFKRYYQTQETERVVII